MKLLSALILMTAIPAMLLAADAQAGQAVYLKSCKTCHGAGGEGNPAVAKALKVSIPDLGSKEVQAKSDDVLTKDIVEGTGKMKPVKTVSGGQVADVLRYVRTLAKKQ